MSVWANISPALSANAPVKRKASEVLDVDDFENVDPTLFSKRPKGASLNPAKESFKPPSFVLTKAASSSNLSKSFLNTTKPATISTTSRPRSFLQAKSPTPRLNTSITKSAPLSAPAGRSPTRGAKRIGILSNRRRTGGPFSRVDPPSFGLASAAPFSLDAALKGTIPSYSGGRSSASTDLTASVGESGMKSDWFFDIHEDTPEQEMTNLLQHGTCTLDISSDEESEVKARRERAEGRDKENIPPADDVSQTRAAGARRAAAAAAAAGVINDDEMALEKARGPLMEMNPADYYAEGCDDSTVVVVAEEEDGEPAVEAQAVSSVPLSEALTAHALEVPGFAATPEAKLDLDTTVEAEQILDTSVTVDVLMGKEEPAAKAAVLEPMEGTGESFELWESGSSKDDTEVPVGSPSPALDVGSVA